MSLNKCHFFFKYILLNLNFNLDGFHEVGGVNRKDVCEKSGISRLIIFADCNVLYKLCLITWEVR